MKRIALLLLALTTLFAGCDVLGTKSLLLSDQADKARVNGDYENAIELYTQSISDSPSAAIYGNRAACHARLEDFANAIADYSKAIQLTEADSTLKESSRDRLLHSWLFHRAFTNQRSGNDTAAIPDYERTIALDEKIFGSAVGPESRRPDAMNNLAWILATSKNPSVRDAKRALIFAGKECERTEWKEAATLDTIAAAYAADGDFEKAIEMQQKAISLNKVAERQSGFEERLNVYQSGKPFVDDR